MSVEISDSVGVLTPAQQSDVEAIQSPHLVKAFIENPKTRDALKEHVLACVKTPNTICIGVSPGLRFTWTEIGLDTGIRSGDYQQVARAGNADFKAAVTSEDANGWTNGIKAIISRAQVLAHQQTSASAVVVQEHQTVIEHPVSAWPFVLGFGLIALFGGWGAVAIYRQQKRTRRVLEDRERETADLAQKNIRTQRWDDEIQKRLDKQEKVEPLRPPKTTLKPVQMNLGDVMMMARKAPVKPTAPASPPQGPNNDFVSGVLVGEALASRPPAVESYSHPPRPRPDPPSSRRSSSSSSNDSSSYSSSSSSFDSFSGGGGGGDIGSSSGGGGGGDF